MKRISNTVRFVGLAALVAASTSCGSVVRDSSSPVYLVIDLLTASRGAGTPGPQTLRAPLKDIGANLSPTTNNEVTINRFHIDYIRADGHNVQGVDVPYSVDGAMTGTVPAGGNVQLGFEIVRHTAKQESPLVELQTSPNIIVTFARITFYGQDRTGNAVSVTGQIQVNFGNFGDF
ncbi:MAG: hypothetical protein DMF93_22050 [Acidobacteria bacterium]|nr:MAG: hypothetical protein DMF93_22050 [Acidobacteriota bacterium]